MSEDIQHDLTRIDLINRSSLEDLSSQEYLENLIINLGFNNEILIEQPKIVKDNFGGLLIWQYPNQFSKYLLLLKSLSIKTYIEIGCRWGGTFILTTEYLKRFNNLTKAVAIDIINSPVKDYCKKNEITEFKQLNTTSDEFDDYITENFLI